MLKKSIGKTYKRLVIRNGTLINGRGTPPEGPVDIVLEDGLIADIIKVDPVSLGHYPSDWERPEGERVIEADGMYIIPGLVDMHAHVPIDNAKCGPEGTEYTFKLWLAHGVTTLRSVGFEVEDALYQLRKRAGTNPELPIPHLDILHGLRLGPDDMDKSDIRRAINDARKQGSDGIKVIGGYADLLKAVCDEVNRLQMPAGVAVHLSLDSGIDALMASDMGVRTIEHTYGIPEAAMGGTQSFPSDYNEMDELKRFRESAFNWIQAEDNPEAILEVLDQMIENGTVWNPTLAVYEANRDLVRAQSLPQNQKYAVAPLRDSWKPTPGIHASFHFDWKTSDEIAWKEKYRLWMKYLREFGDRGGTITVGSDAGSLYTLHGFSMIREMELLQESGFHPVNIIKMATTDAHRTSANAAKTEGIRKGAPADIAIVDGNPIDNFKIMYGTDTQEPSLNGESPDNAGKIRWTIRDGVLFDAPKLLRDAKDYVDSFEN